MTDKFTTAGEAGRALIAAHVIEGGPGDPDTLELAATLCNFAPAMVEALRWIKDEYCEGGMLDGTEIEERICAILARIDGETVCASCGAPEGESHGQKCEARAFAAGASIRRAES